VLGVGDRLFLTYYLPSVSTCAPGGTQLQETTELKYHSTIFYRLLYEWHFSL